jgi:hypothetical protein
MIVRSVGRIVLFIMALIGLIAGCSNNQASDVTGTVTVDGEPVEKGSISFIPADGKSNTAGGDIVNGKYVATNVPVGSMKVQIRVPKVTGKKKLYETADSAYRDTFSESLPKKFNDQTELRLDVQPGKNEKNWELSTK